jgi:uracil-DNA glycosylase family 4
MIEKINTIEQNVFNCNCEHSTKIVPHPFAHHIVKENYSTIKYLFIGRNPGCEHDYADSKAMNEEEYNALYNSRFLKSNFYEYFISIFNKEFIDKNMMFTNVVKCPTPDNNEPSLQMYGACFPHLLRQIDTIKPKKIFVFGRSIARALTMLCGYNNLAVVSNIYKGNFTHYKIIDGDKLKFAFTILYHPSFFQRGGSTLLNNSQIELLKKECQ